jgi:hypothetical protein
VDGDAPPGVAESPPPACGGRAMPDREMPVSSGRRKDISGCGMRSGVYCSPFDEPACAGELAAKPFTPLLRVWCLPLSPYSPPSREFERVFLFFELLCAFVASF